MLPLLIEGTRILGPALVAAAKTIPPAQLARVGLLRGPFVGLGSTFGAFLGGAALVALVVPQSRAWVLECAGDALRLARQWGEGDWSAKAQRTAAWSADVDDGVASDR